MDRTRRSTPDAVLTQASIYWFTQTAGSSAQIYLEHVRAGGRGAPIEVDGPGRRRGVPERTSRRRSARLAEGLNIVRWTEMPRGGHFAAMEEPELLVEDVRAFFRPLR